MEAYKGYFIDGDALMTHPFSPNWYAPILDPDTRKVTR